MLAATFKDRQGNPERGFAGDSQGEGERPPHTQGAGEAQPTQADGCLRVTVATAAGAKVGGEAARGC